MNMNIHLDTHDNNGLYKLGSMDRKAVCDGR